MSHLIVKRHHPLWRRNLLIGLTLVALLFAFWGSFEYGRHRAGFDRVTARNQSESLLGQIAQQEDEIIRLREALAIQERAAQIEKAAHKEIDGTVLELQDEIVELKSELDFYRGIISPTESKGLVLKGFELSRPTLGEGYHYKIVLTQGLGNRNYARGVATIEVSGMRGDEPVVIDHKSLFGDKNLKGGIPFKFKYFQNLEGEFVLPEGVVPSKVVIKVDPKGTNLKTLSEEFSWRVEEES